jgi:hypothetical protein
MRLLREPEGPLHGLRARALAFVRISPTADDARRNIIPTKADAALDAICVGYKVLPAPLTIDEALLPGANALHKRPRALCALPSRRVGDITTLQVDFVCNDNSPRTPSQRRSICRRDARRSVSDNEILQLRIAARRSQVCAGTLMPVRRGAGGALSRRAAPRISDSAH